MRENWPQGIFEEIVVPRVREIMAAKCRGLLEEIEDLAQDAQMKVWLDRGCLTVALWIASGAAAKSQLEPYLQTCADDVWKDYLRKGYAKKRNRFATIHLGGDDQTEVETQEIPDDRPTPAERLLIDEERTWVQSRVGQLPLTQREVLQLSMQDFTNTEIAELLKIPPNRVNQSLHRARKTLLGWYRAQHPDSDE